MSWLNAEGTYAMGQSNYIAAALALAFIIYVTMKGSLSKYIEILTGSGGFAQDTASAGNSPSQTVASSSQSSDAQQTASASSSSGSSSNAAASSPPLTILQQVMATGGQADMLLDGVKMFGAGA